MRQLPKLELGDSGAILMWGGPEGEPILKLFDDCNLTIGIENGDVVLSTVIRDEKGETIAELVRNEWRVNPQKAFDRNYAKGAIEVRDATGDVVLQARLREDRVQLSAKFRDAEGNAVGIGKIRGPDGKVGGAIEFTGRDHPRLTLEIMPLFRYPSDLHLGEYIVAPRSPARPKRRRVRRKGA
jgi:hypothetical protein